MKKRIIRKLSIFWLQLFIFCGVAFSASAQEPPKFKIGDRVECDASGSRTYWNKGTVIPFKEGDIYNGYSSDSGYFYRVRMDNIPDAPEGYLVPASNIRPLAEAKPAQIQNKSDVSDNQPDKTAAARASAKLPDDGNCKIATDLKLVGAASAALFKAIIKAQFDKEAKAGMDGAVCLSFTNFKLGAAQQWQPARDPRRVGTDRLGTKPKIIYPVKADYIVTTYYNTARQMTEWTGTTYTCFKEEQFGEWKCRGEQGFDWKYKNTRIEKERP